MDQVPHTSLLGLRLPELASLVEELGQPPYRARQLFEGLYRQRVETAEQISTLPEDFRRSLLEKGISVGVPRIEKKFVSSDGTVRYLVACADGQSVETVWMPEGERSTICISTQVGCPADCKFCLTALLGLERSLSTGEIAVVLKTYAPDPYRPRVRVLRDAKGSDLERPYEVNLWEDVEGQSKSIQAPLDPAIYGIDPLSHL
jgi:23S rRNA (adenine2503-C2)-methyltransferase